MMVKKKQKSIDELIFLPLGGAGEIGMNLNLYGFGPEHDRRWLMVDLGVTFTRGEPPGIDVITPDISFIEEKRDDLMGLVLTHGHEDHIGAVPYLWSHLKCPVYATSFTASLVKGKLVREGFEEEAAEYLHVLPLKGSLNLGPFDIELVTLTHSIAEPNGLLIRTPLGNIFHTGDWKIDPDPLIGEAIDEDALGKIGVSGIRALICDSTNVFEEGVAGSEAQIFNGLYDLVKSCTGRVAVTTFASNIARLGTIAEVAKACDRHIVLAGRSMHRMVEAARQNGFLTNVPKFIEEHEARTLPPETVLILCTGSQGEPRAALMRLAEDKHPSLRLEEGDTVIFSSRSIPGNEVDISDMKNMLVERGIDIITNRGGEIHVSGHPCRDELTHMYSWIKPQVAIPVHGEARHLAEHARLAQSLQVPEVITARNGDMVHLAPDKAHITDQVPYGRIYVDGDLLVSDGDPALHARRTLANAGVVFVALVLNKKGQLIEEPDVHALGLPDGESDELPVRDMARQAAREALASQGFKKVLSPDRIDERQTGRIKDLVRRYIRQAIQDYWGKKPLIEVSLVIV
ncbi:MAG: ribonuclease J [Parvularculales bacterium]